MTLSAPPSRDATVAAIVGPRILPRFWSVLAATFAIVSPTAAAPRPPTVPAVEIDHRGGVSFAWTNFHDDPQGRKAWSPLVAVGVAAARDDSAIWLDFSISPLLDICGAFGPDSSSCITRGVALAVGYEWRLEYLTIGPFLGVGGGIEPGARVRWQFARTAGERLRWSAELTGIVPIADFTEKGVVGVLGSLALSAAFQVR